MKELRLKVATVWRGEWSADVAYNVLDEVSFSSDVEGVKRGNYRSLIAANREPLSNEYAWVLVLDLEKTQSATKEAEMMNKSFADAENDRVKNENKRITDEDNRIDEEKKRASEESKRIENERKRSSSENNRNNAETNRRISEETRISNEQARKSTESSRVTAETNRVSAENQRTNNEQLRVTAENARVAAETNRANAFITAQINREEAFNAAEAGRDAKIEAKVEDITRLQGEVAKKANIDGYYSSMAVGAAESLIGQNATTQQFTFQPSGNTLDVQDGLAVVKSIKGNTVVVNQFLRTSLFKSQTKEGVALTNNGDGTYTLSGHPTGGAYFQAVTHPIANHKYYTRGGYNSDLYLYFSGADYGNGVIGLPANIAEGGIAYYPRIYFSANLDLSAPITIRPIVIDLTQMFGAGNEPTTVEEFERLYPNLSAEYNEGSLLNLNADSIKSVGFNQWDEEWELGKIDYNGNLVPENNTICSKNYIKVLLDTDYFFNINANDYIGYYLCFDENYKNIYPDTAYLSPMNGLKHIPANCHYIKFFINETSVYNNDICINLSHSGYRNGEYEPYKESIANLPIKKYFPDGMKSAGSVRDEIVWDERLKKYKAIQRIGSVDLGNFTFTKNSYGKFYAILNNKKRGVEGNIDLLCSKYISKPSVGSSYFYSNIGACIWSEINTFAIFIQDDNFTDSNILKESLAGQILYYELAEPIETIIDDYNRINYEISDFGTEEIIADEPTTPIVAEIVYGVNAVDTLRRLPQTYISADSMRNFLAQLGSVMNGNWAIEFNDINNEWVFAFTANEVIDNEE